MAERRVFSTSRAIEFLVKRRMARASAAFFPRMRSSTSLAFWAEVRRHLVVAWVSSIGRPLGLGRRRRGRPRGRHLGHLLDLRGVALELAGGRELAELV